MIIEKGVKVFKVLGIMSGSSLDGVDLAFCSFWQEAGKWQYRTEHARTIPYPDYWRKKLPFLEKATALELAMADREYGYFLGDLVNQFTKESGQRPSALASHGHTVFHRPSEGMTFQLGSGAAMAGRTALPVVCDFRSLDLAMGGQGAPLVPIGDALLYGSYDFCLNLGGFCNISFDENNRRIAYDIAPCNMVLNHYAAKAGRAFDENGRLASRGQVNLPLLERLERLDYYRLPPPKSLGKEWVISEFLPVVETWPGGTEDVLCTLTEHVSGMIASALGAGRGKQVLTTGGGAHNLYLIHKIMQKTRQEIVIPDTLTVDFKEAVVFAFLGLLRLQNQVNVLASVTGARADHSGGCIFWP